MRSATGPEPIGDGEWIPAFDPCEVVSHPHILEVLDALRHGPASFPELRSCVRVGRRGLASALRIAAAHGLVAKSDIGSWDAVVADKTVYWQTDRGRRIVEELCRFSVWTSMWERVPGPPIDSTASDRGSCEG
jgi:DNA-binding HxlR family transcriptional regulator